MISVIHLFGVLSTLLALRTDLLQELQNVQQRTREAQMKTRALDVRNEPNDRLILEFKKETTEAQLEEKLKAILDGIDFKIYPLFPGEEGKLKMFFVVELPTIPLRNISTGPFDPAHELRKELDLASCDPSFYQPVDVPNVKKLDRSTRSSSGSGGDPKELPDNEWHLKNARVPEAWKFSEEKERPVAGKNIIIAQIDTGYTHHYLLKGCIQGGIDLVDQSPQGPIDPLDYGGGINNPGHGTAVAAIASSRGKEESGKRTMRGSARNAKVMPIRAIKSVFVAWENQWDKVAQGIVEAKNRGAHVISMSLGGLMRPSAVEAAIRDAVKRDLIIVAAAGQISSGGVSLPLGPVVYPAKDPNVIAVAGSTIESKPWWPSCRGKEVDISAPSDGILFADPQLNDENKVGIGSGTSFGTALTAGIASMWLAHHGNDINRFRGGRIQSAFAKCLKDSAFTPVDWNGNFGAGIINAKALLEFDFENIEKDLRAPVESKLTMDELSNMGVAPNMFERKLTEDDLMLYGNELLWAIETELKPTESKDELGLVLNARSSLVTTRDLEVESFKDMPTTSKLDLEYFKTSSKVLSPDLKEKLGL